MSDVWTDELRSCVEDLKNWRKVYSENPKSPEGQTALSCLRREADRTSGCSSYFYVLEHVTHSKEVDSLVQVANKALNLKKLQTSVKIKAGRKSEFPDGPAQAEFGFKWLRKTENRCKSSRDAALYTLTVETSKRNKKNPPEWLNGYPFPDVKEDRAKRDKSLKSLAAAIQYKVDNESKNSAEFIS